MPIGDREKDIQKIVDSFKSLKKRAKIFYSRLYFLHIIGIILFVIAGYNHQWLMAFIFYILLVPDADDCITYVKKLFSIERNSVEK